MWLGKRLDTGALFAVGLPSKNSRSCTSGLHRMLVEIGEGLALWDAPGDLDEAAAWDVASLQLRDRLAGRAAAVLVVLVVMVAISAVSIAAVA